MSNRETILAALRGAKACAGCARYGAVDPFAKAAVGCPECQAALAAAVLAAVQPPGAEAERLRLQLDCGNPADADPMACRLDAGNLRYNAVEMCAACSERASATTLARTREALAAAQAQERALRGALADCGPPRIADALVDGAVARLAAIIAQPADTAALGAALRRARADALREAGATCPPCAIDPGDPPCVHAQRLRRMADDAEAAGGA